MIEVLVLPEKNGRADLKALMKWLLGEKENEQYPGGRGKAR